MDIVFIFFLYTIFSNFHNEQSGKKKLSFCSNDHLETLVFTNPRAVTHGLQHVHTFIKAVSTLSRHAKAVCGVVEARNQEAD